MSWLVQIEVDAAVAITERIMDNYGWHQKLWECFPRDPDSKRDFLTRIDMLESAVRLWILARRQPSCPRWCSPERFVVKQISPSFLSHRHYAFDLVACPTKAIAQRGKEGEPLVGPNGRRQRGKVQYISNPQELHEWLVRKGVEGGFEISESPPLEIGPMQMTHFRKKSHAGFHGGTQFRGTLSVTDSQRFAQTYYSGIGRAKGFGFGLLLLAPINL